MSSLIVRARLAAIFIVLRFRDDLNVLIRTGLVVRGCLGLNRNQQRAQLRLPSART